MNSAIGLRALPRAAPARVLAVGAWLKNRAGLLDGMAFHTSTLHGDLGTPEACRALDDSLQALLRIAGGRIDAVAHDLHPDFESTRLALALAHELGVPAVAVQHHHAHIGVVQAEQGELDATIGLALDGVGLGSDGLAWGGELLRVQGAAWQRLQHLTPLAMPGGDIAAREPWRMAAALLHALGRAGEIVPRFAPQVGERLATGVATLLERRLNCPLTTSAGRWFDALAGLLGVSLRQREEAEAAIAFERMATIWLADHAAPRFESEGLDLLPLASACLERIDAAGADKAAATGAAAALFHTGLADTLAGAAIAAAEAAALRTVALGGGCFYNRLLNLRLTTRLAAAGLAVRLPQADGPGDGGLALGQAWIAAHEFDANHRTAPAAAATTETAACA